jgi:hypothetical protein
MSYPDNSRAFDNYDSRFDPPDDDYLEIYELTDEDQELISKIQSLIDNYPRIEKTANLEDFFDSAPEGDFKWEEDDPGDPTPYYCDDCKTWHIAYYNTIIGRENGNRYIDLMEGDSSGNWDIYIAWQEGEDPTDLLDFYIRLHDLHFERWASYWLWCAEEQHDPLQELLEKKDNTTREFFEFCIKSAMDFIKYLYPQDHKFDIN